MLSVTAVGRLVRYASLKFTADGSPVLGFTVACDVGYGENKSTCYVNCSVWGKRAEALDPYLKKGLAVTVIGNGQLREWEQNEKHGAEITCNVSEVVMQGSKSDKPAEKPAEKPPAKGFRDKPAPAPDFNDDSDLPF